MSEGVRARTRDHGVLRCPHPAPVPARPQECAGAQAGSGSRVPESARRRGGGQLSLIRPGRAGRSPARDAPVPATRPPRPGRRAGRDPRGGGTGPGGRDLGRQRPRAASGSRDEGRGPRSPFPGRGRGTGYSHAAASLKLFRRPNPTREEGVAAGEAQAPEGTPRGGAARGPGLLSGRLGLADLH